MNRFSYFNIDVETKTSGPTLKINRAIHPFKVSEHATKHSSTRVQSSHQKDRLCRNAAAECYLCVLNCTKRDTLCQQRVQPRIQKLALANYQIPLSNAKQYLQKNTQCGLRFGSRFLTPKWGQSPRLIYFCNNNGADSHFGSRFPAPKMGANFESFFVFQYRR